MHSLQSLCQTGGFPTQKLVVYVHVEYIRENLSCTYFQNARSRPRSKRMQFEDAIASPLTEPCPWLGLTIEVVVLLRACEHLHAHPPQFRGRW